MHTRTLLARRVRLATAACARTHAHTRTHTHTHAHTHALTPTVDRQIDGGTATERISSAFGIDG